MEKLFIIAVLLLSFSAFADTPIQTQLDKLEKKFDGKIGVYALDTNNNQVIEHRADEHFPTQSTMKLIAVAALFKQSNGAPNLLQETVHYTKNDLTYWHPVTGQHVATGMTYEALAEAAMSYSDNVAANLIIKKLGGPAAVTAYARSIGNPSFNVEHYEGNLNSNPHHTQDASTPKDMAMSLQKLTLGNALTSEQRTQFVTWMQNNTTSYQRIRVGTPVGWMVADKTGTGDYGVANDIGILWSPACKPIVLSIYTARNQANAKSRDDVIASTTHAVLESFSTQDACFKALTA